MKTTSLILVVGSLCLLGCEIEELSDEQKAACKSNETCSQLSSSEEAVGADAAAAEEEGESAEERLARRALQWDACQNQQFLRNTQEVNYYYCNLILYNNNSEYNSYAFYDDFTGWSDVGGGKREFEWELDENCNLQTYTDTTYNWLEMTELEYGVSNKITYIKQYNNDVNSRDTMTCVMGEE